MRLQSGRLSLDVEDVKVDEIIRQAEEIWVESKVDHGSTFSFSLPAVNVPADKVETLV